MTVLNVYTFALPFLVMGAAVVIYWWTGRDNHHHAR